VIWRPSVSWSVPARARILLCLALFAPASTRAQLPPRISLDVSAPASCPHTPLLEADVARLVGSEVGEVEPTEVMLSLTHEGGEAHALGLTIVTRDERYERHMRLPTCAEAREAAALLIASALRPDLLLSLPEAPAPVREEPPTERRAPRLGVWLGLGGLLDARSLPGPSGGPSLGVGLSRRALRTSLDARTLLARRSDDPTSRFTALIDLFAGALGVAWLMQLGALRVGPAAALELGVLRARGSGERAPRDGTTFWSAAFVGAEAELPLHERLSLTLGLAVGAPLARPSFRLLDEPPFYVTSAVTGRLTLGVRLHLRSEN